MTDNQISNESIHQLLKYITEQNNEIKAQNAQIVEQNRDIKEDLKRFKEESKTYIENLKKENKELKEENCSLKNRLIATERKVKKYNLLIYGLQGEEQQTFQSVVSLFKNKLGVSCSENDIRDAYRVGKKSEGKARSVVVELSTNRLKFDILQNCNKLKGSGIFITLDHTPEDLLKQKFLISQQNLAREKNIPAKIKNNSLFINGNHYSYDALIEGAVDIAELSSQARKTGPGNKQTTSYVKQTPVDSAEKPTGTKPKRATNYTPRSLETRSGNRNRIVKN